MKKVFFVISVFFITVFLAGCAGKAYAFKQPVDEIQSIEIVSAENSHQFFSRNTLSEEERKDFISQFQELKFYTYYVGDPMSVNGDAVKLTYRNGDYEIISYYWAEYVKNGDTFGIRRHCDEKEFYDLLCRFPE